MGRRELREHIFRLLFRRDFFPEEEMKEQEALYIEYLADPEQEEVDYIVRVCGRSDRLIECYFEFQCA